MGQFMRLSVCLLLLITGGCGGALLLDSTLGARERERVRALYPNDPICGGPGIDIYLIGGFLLGVLPVGWGLRRSGAIRWAIGTRTPPDDKPPNPPGT